MAYYSVLEVTVTNDEWVELYLSVATKLVEKHGGKYLARTINHQRIEGQGVEPALRIIIEWPSKQASHNFMNDPEYTPHLNARTQGSISNHWLIEGKDDMA